LIWSGGRGGSKGGSYEWNKREGITIYSIINNIMGINREGIHHHHLIIFI